MLFNTMMEQNLRTKEALLRKSFSFEYFLQFFIRKLITAPARSSYQRCAIQKRLAGLKGCNFKRLQFRCFPVNIAKFLRKPILKNICKRLLLISLFITVFHTKHFNLGGSKIDIFNNNSFQVIKNLYVVVFAKDCIVSENTKLYL